MELANSPLNTIPVYPELPNSLLVRALPYPLPSDTMYSAKYMPLPQIVTPLPPSYPSYPLQIPVDLCLIYVGTRTPRSLLVPLAKFLVVSVHRRFVSVYSFVLPDVLPHYHSTHQTQHRPPPNVLAPLSPTSPLHVRSCPSPPLSPLISSGLKQPPPRPARYNTPTRKGDRGFRECHHGAESNFQLCFGRCDVGYSEVFVGAVSAGPRILIGRRGCQESFSNVGVDLEGATNSGYVLHTGRSKTSGCMLVVEVDLRGGLVPWAMNDACHSKINDIISGGIWSAYRS